MTENCGCRSHKGPHWLYMDFLDRERNLKHLEYAVRCAETGSWQQLGMALHTVMQEDLYRLNEKRYNMERENALNGESRAYPYTLLGIDKRVEHFEQRRRSLWDRLERAIPKESRRNDETVLQKDANASAATH